MFAFGMCVQPRLPHNNISTAYAGKPPSAERTRKRSYWNETPPQNHNPQKNSASKPSYPLVSYSPLSQVNEPTPTQYDDPEDAFVEAVASETNLIPRRVNRTSGPRSPSSKASEWKRFTTERILSAKKKGLFPIDESQNDIADGVLDGKRQEVKSVGSASTGSSSESTTIGRSKWKTLVSRLGNMTQNLKTSR